MKFTLNQIKSALNKKGHKIFTRPWELNIVGVRYNISDVNKFNDYICVFFVDKKGRETYLEFPATTEPGSYWLKNANDPGTAILVPGQYTNAYHIRKHQGKYEAVCQQKPVRVYRDNNRDLIYDLDPSTIDVGLFGINIHRSNPKTASYLVNKWSAGCQVFQRASDFAKFMKLAKAHRRHHSNNFTYTLIEKFDIDGIKPDPDEDVNTRFRDINGIPEYKSRKPARLPKKKKVKRYGGGNKDIVVINEKELKLNDLKIQTLGGSVFEEQFTGELLPYILYNNYTFNYKQIDTFTLSYENKIPKLVFGIDDINGEFNGLFLAKETDVITLYLKSNAVEYKSVYMEFFIDTLTKSDNYYIFECTMNVPELFTEECKSYDNVSSFEVFQNVAKELKLGFNSNVTSTDDAMNWIQAFDPYLGFLKDVVWHSYKGENTFMDFYIDFYYHLNYVDLDNQFGDYKQQDSIITLVDDHIKSEYDEDDKKVGSKLILTNAHLFHGTNNYIYDYNSINTTGEIKQTNGYERKVKFYDSQLRSIETHNVKPHYETQDNEKIRSVDDKHKLVKYKWEGLQLTDAETKNVHDNYLFSKVYRKQNIEEISKMKLHVKLDKANYHLYRYQSIPIALYEYNEETKKKIAQANDVDTNLNFPIGVLLEQYSGHYVIENIIYTYDSSDKYIRQELVLMRREWNQNKEK